MSFGVPRLYLYLFSCPDTGNPCTTNTCSSNTCVETDLTPEFPILNGFEDGSGSCSWNCWTDGGRNAALITNKNNRHSGNCALRLQDDTTSSRVTSSWLDVDNFITLKVSFWYRPRKNIENFHLDIKKDGGSFLPERTWDNLGSGYKQAFVDIDVAGVKKVKVRFESEGASKKDRVFIDEITVDAIKD